MFSYKQLLKSILAFGVAVSIVACADDPSAESVVINKPKQRTVILVLGDSTSQGYGVEKFGEYYEDVPPGKMYADLLRNRLINERIDEFAPISVINASLGSEFAFEAADRLPQLLSTYRPTHVILAHGTNDARAVIPLSEISNTFVSMINMIRNSGAKPLLADMTLTVYGLDYANAYSQMVKDTAFKAAATYVPILEGIIWKPQYVLNDGYGYHYNETAQPLMMNNVWNKLITLF